MRAASLVAGVVRGGVAEVVSAVVALTVAALAQAAPVSAAAAFPDVETAAASAQERVHDDQNARDQHDSESMH